MNTRSKLLNSLKNPPTATAVPTAPAQSAAPGSTPTAPPKASAPKAKRPAILAGVADINVWLREMAKDILAVDITEKTKEQHRRNGARLDAMRVDGEAISLDDYATVPATFYAYRASVRWHAALTGLDAVQAYDRARKEKNDVAAAVAYQRILYAAADLKTYPKDASPGLPNSKNIALGIDDARPESVPAKAKREGRTATAPRETSKLKAANSIAKKYPDWRSLLWVQLTSIKSPWLDHTAVAALTGARPEELRTAKYQRFEDGLRVVITGAKVSATKGQAWRMFTLKNDGTSEFAHLFAKAEKEWLKAEKEWLTVDLPDGITDYPDAFSAALARAGKKVLPKAERMSGYVYRHALASDLKADGFSREQIAAALGHAVTKTQDAYGRAVGGKAGKRSLSVECAREIKVTHDTRYTTPAPQIAPETISFSTPSFGDLGL